MATFYFEPDVIERVATTHEGNAAWHSSLAAELRETQDVRRGLWSKHQMLAASSLVIAASYWSIINGGQGVRLYRKAASLYREMGHSYALVLALASGTPREIGAALSVADDVREPDPQTVAFALVANQLFREADGSRTERLVARWRQIGNYPVGRLGIPLDNYAQCGELMSYARHSRQPEQLFFAASTYLRRAAEIIRMASHDRFHWTRLESAILPAEPEAVAMTAAIAGVARSMFQLRRLEIPELDDEGKMLVQIGEELAEIGSREDLERA